MTDGITIKLQRTAAELVEEMADVILRRVNGEDGDNIQTIIDRKLDKLFEAEIIKRIDAIVEAEVRQRVVALFDDGILVRREYGRTDRVPAADFLREHLSQKISLSYNSEKTTLVERVAKDVLETALRDELRKDLETARIEFRAKVDSTLTGMLVDAARKAVGMP